MLLFSAVETVVRALCIRSLKKSPPLIVDFPDRDAAAGGSSVQLSLFCGATAVRTRSARVVLTDLVLLLGARMVGRMTMVDPPCTWYAVTLKSP